MDRMSQDAIDAKRRAQAALTRCHSELVAEGIQHACLFVLGEKPLPDATYRLEVVDEVAMLTPQAPITPYGERVAAIGAIERWCERARANLEHLLEG